MSSNRLGFMGGYALAVLTCRVCQTFPHETSDSALLARFFAVYSQWNFATTPVMIDDPMKRNRYRMDARVQCAVTLNKHSL